MFARRRIVIIGIAAAAIFLVAYTLSNRNALVREHMTPAPPTVASLQRDLRTTQGELKTLSDEFHDLKTQAGAQAQEAAAAKASLAAIH
jgi:hypothetical protein